MDVNSVADFANFLNNPQAQVLLILLTVWNLVWKGIALWKASKNNQRNWFIFMLVLNTFGILEIVYIFYFSRPKSIKVPEQEPK